MNSVWVFLHGHKDALDAVQAAVTTLAVIIGGGWALLHFSLKREQYPKAKLKHRFTLSPYDDVSRVLRIELKLENVGDTLVEVRAATNRLQQVYPRAQVAKGAFVAAPSKNSPEIPWPMLGEREYAYAKGDWEAEPKESDAMLFDYVIPTSVELVVVYSYVENAAKRHRWLIWKEKEIGWQLTETVNLNSL
jgi:hypothetical protein